ncbi:type II secretion system protein [Luteimonas yindakuii]|uniref:Type II secretion system protein n=1 Tax=Luteimonas yindakuii TaxID=2565782 RepID=A0A4Z1QZW1_9GAMM|nr:type II secretion system protein [Luteimonas yindakuii]TKS52810.1 type II secretion system protein [Luteimonas yindakuii]
MPSRSPPLLRRNMGGFSLLEAIVTLVVVSLIVTVLMQALAQALDMRERLLRHQRQSRTAALQEQWFRDSVSSALSDLPDALGHLEGDAGVLNVLTSAPLVGQGLSRVRWEVVEASEGLALAYDGPGWAGVVVPAPLREARFSYMDREGGWHSDWAPEVPADAAPGTVPMLPRMVRFQAETTRGEMTWLVPVRSEPYVPQRMRVGSDGI